MRFREIRSVRDLLDLVNDAGFLPFFANAIPGFSVEECCPRELWFAADADGPWEWKGPAARSRECIYGKFFGGKAGFVSREWVPDFVNLRRDGYDFDARFDDGLASLKDKDVYDVVSAGDILSKDLKRACGYCKGGLKGFETVITRLQMQTYITVSDFVYMQDRHGKVYGWGVAKYSTPETILGSDFTTSRYSNAPARSRERIEAHLRHLLPDADESKLLKLL